MGAVRPLLALDLGTTNLAGRLVDERGLLLAQMTLRNPQAEWGADIVRRLDLAGRGRSRELQQRLVAGINDLTAELLRQGGVSARQLAAAAAAGNSGISALLRRLPVERILFPPHRAPDSRGRHLDASELGLKFSVPLYLFPQVTGYVGGDLVAFLFSQDPPRGCTLFMDIGTNGELALFYEGRWRVTSVAAGPAFEGEGISCGMAASAGAVRGVTLEGDRLRLQVIGGGRPQGLCGSGLAEAVAAAVEGGLINCHGTLVDPLQVPGPLSRYLGRGPEGPCLRLYRDADVDLTLSQQDIRAFQLAKGALRAGVDCLLRRVGVSADTVEHVVVTGGFGFSLSAAVLKKVAMLPGNMVERVRFSEAGVLCGCVRLLCDSNGPERAQVLADSLRPHPLSGTPDFEQAFLGALDF